LDPEFKDHAYEGRYEALQPVNEGKWLIHGHVHGSWKVKGKQINVGVDVWQYAPVALDTVLDIMGNNPNGIS
jgi:calcineurin-like phosphoesterase family protein